MPLLSKQFKGYVPDCRQPGIVCVRHPAGMQEFTKFKVIDNGTFQYNKPKVSDNSRGSAAVNVYKEQAYRSLYHAA